MSDRKIELSRNGMLFLTSPSGGLIQIPLGDILAAYYKNRDTANWRKGVCIQFLDRTGVFYKDETEPSLDYRHDGTKKFKGSMSIVEVEVPNLSLDGLLKVMSDYRVETNKDALDKMAEYHFTYGAFDTDAGYFTFINPTKQQ